ncbi:Ubiquitin carboxyl-terminal hydrolase isozyme L3 [Sarcoptes scabiei]|uniref:Ubiquitin carboxyl-terminal hydrolase n=1 Tax=Sarcoptes scabiei TaxID=52283 RepID=A0A834RET8_SARSC|nr:Ubiquitin carboxyl-terminal hydrolase isozyme L3 [Sarcoptes scabiei]UXI14159.1 hypothetical protein NH340_JMT00102 [Sarcoptes scabiei]
MSVENETYWNPLESDPETMTEYLQLISMTPYRLIDVPSVDLAEELGIFNQNIFAYIFLFPMIKHKKLGTIEIDGCANGLFFMKQFIHNSCGSIALLHAYFNSISPKEFVQDSLLHTFYYENCSKDPDSIGKAFAEGEDFKKTHHEMSLLGQSHVPTGDDLENIDLHFVAFVPFKNNIYELDGREDGPINHGSTTSQTFKSDCLAIIKKYMLQNPESYNFSILALCS